ncbi:MAG: cytochrome P450 [Pirellulales bacterium]
MMPSPVKTFPATALPVTRTSLADFKLNLFDSIRGLHAKYGDIAAVDDGSLRVVFSFHPRYNQQVLSDATTYHARFFAIRGPKRSAQRRVTCGLLAMNGDQHRRNRRAVKERFSLKAIASYRAPIEGFVDQMLSTWRAGEIRDINRDMTRYMLEVTSTILFGLEEPKLAYELGEQVAAWVAMNHELGVGALVPDATFSARYEELLQFAEGLEERVMEMIRRRRRETGGRHDVLSLLVRSHDEEGGLTDEELVGQACVLFGAAHMTTSHSLTWTLLLLAQHPEIARQLWTESTLSPSSVLGGGARGGGIPDSGTAEPLVDRIIRESMRVLPASAYSQRINDVAVKLGPFDLPRGTPIVFTPLVTHHLAEFYPEPERFDPDRWLTIRPSAYEYIPFGGGPRLCIGGPLAMEILRTTLPRIAAKFSLAVEPGVEINAEVCGTMLNPAGPVPMRLTPAGTGYATQEIHGNVNELCEFPTAEPAGLRRRMK